METHIKKNQVEMYQMQTWERQPNPQTAGGPSPRTTWRNCCNIHQYRVDYFEFIELKFLRRTLKNGAAYSLVKQQEQ